MMALAGNYADGRISSVLAFLAICALLALHLWAMDRIQDDDDNV